MPEVIEKDLTHDVIGGNAGLILALNSLVDSKEFSEKAKNIIILAANNLLTKVKITNNLPQWGKEMLLGYSHGNAGYAHAFSIANEIKPDKNYIKIIENLIKSENKFFDETYHNWPDFRYDDSTAEGKRFVSAWCHGAPGIGLGRLKLWESSKADEYLNDYKNAINGLEKSQERNSYCLCHGMSGNIELVLSGMEIGVINKELYYESFIDNMIDSIHNDLLSNRHPQLLGPELMTGLSGICFQLLRILNPKNVPSVLTLSK